MGGLQNDQEPNRSKRLVFPGLRNERVPPILVPANRMQSFLANCLTR
jgi:hypothetical protein